MIYYYQAAFQVWSQTWPEMGLQREVQREEKKHKMLNSDFKKGIICIYASDFEQSDPISMEE